MFIYFSDILNSVARNTSDNVNMISQRALYNFHRIYFIEISFVLVVLWNSDCLKINDTVTISLATLLLLLKYWILTCCINIFEMEYRYFC